jgi:potassium-dependent mechanosensitive channel
MPNNAILQLLLIQIRILWLYLQRPSVQLQILVLIGTFLLAILLAQALRWVVRRYLVPDVVAQLEDDDDNQMDNATATEPVSSDTTPPTSSNQNNPQTGWRRWLYAAQPLFLPTITFLCLQIFIPIFQINQQPVGLLLASQIVLLLFLLYRTVVALLYSRLRAKQARFYDRFLLFPAFLIFTLNLFLLNLNIRELLFQLPLPNFFGLELTIGDSINFVLIIAFAFIASRVVQDVLSHIVHRRIDLDKDIERSVVNLGRNATIAIGVILALGSLGISLTALTFIAGGLSVGIGAGLSTIASNLVSGVLLWSDDTVRLGDVIQINNEMGTVEKMGIRSTIVRTPDNVELIVPNEDFMTQVVTAYTKSNRLVRTAVHVGVSYNTDATQVRQILLDIAAEHGLVRDDPPPNVFFDTFGESSLDFRLMVWVDEPNLSTRVRSDLNFMILKRFRDAGIEIPFPQRELHLRSPAPELSAPLTGSE